MSYIPTYDKARYPIQPGKGLCRGCGQPVPKHRQSWCSNACVERWHPKSVIAAVKKRDKQICQLCGVDLKELYRQWYAARPDMMKDGHDAYIRWTKEVPTAEYDHIVPFCEGGLTVLENMRTLCGPCHRKRTREWRRTKAVCLSD